jgi:hypothetical protein
MGTSMMVDLKERFRVERIAYSKQAAKLPDLRLQEDHQSATCAV